MTVTTFGIIFLCFTPFFLVFLFYYFVYYRTHIEMTEMHFGNAPYINFQNIKTLYSKEGRKWQRWNLFSTSLFCTETDSEFHASLVKFDGQFFKLDLISYILFQFWKKREMANYEEIKVF